MTSRSYLGTLHVQSDEFPFSRTEDCKYFVCQLEKAPTTGALHWQFFVQFTKPHRRQGAMDFLGIGHASMYEPKHEKIPVSVQEWHMAKYCKKSETYVEGTRYECGSMNTQGKRNDLVKIKDDILAGKQVDDIILENPMAYHQYGRTMEKIETIKMCRQRRYDITTGLWLWGGTDVGKSHTAFELAGYLKGENDFYTWVKGSEFQCGYKQQSTVVINEFRGELKFSTLLDMVDKWDFKVMRKGKEAIPFVTKLVIVTSSMKPEDVYSNCLQKDDNLNQLLRRFEVRKLEKH